MNHKKKVKTVHHYTDVEVKEVEALFTMIATISGIPLEIISSVVKESFFSGVLSRANSDRWYAESPFIMNLIVAYIESNHTSFKIAQMVNPRPIRDVCDALLKYKPVIIDEYTHKLNELNDIKPNPLAEAIANS